MELPCNSSRIINIGKLFRAYSLPSETPAQDYLREALTKVLQDESVEFDFKIQVRNKDEDFGDQQVLIENATTTWEKGNRPEIDSWTKPLSRRKTASPLNL